MQGNNWLVIVSNSNPAGDKFNSDSRLQLNVSGVINAAVGTWATVYTNLSSTSTVAGNFNDAWLDQVTRLAMHLQWGTSVPSTDVFIKNPRFQKSTLGVPISPSTVPALDVASKTVTANAPASGQAVEFAISEDGIAPASGWVDGIHNDNVYTHQFAALPSADTYYVFARAKADSSYNFVGASSRITVTSIGEQTLVDEAAASLTWDTIKGSNLSNNDVKSQLSLPTAIGTTNVAWSSDNAAISATGSVNRLLNREVDKTVILTATITKGTASATQTFTVTVKAVPAAVNARAATYFPNIEEGTINTVAPDGNQAVKLGAGKIGAGAERIWNAASGSQDLLGYANQYFVFDMYVTHADLLNLNGNNWIAVAAGGNNLDTNSRLNLNANEIRNGHVNEWMTVYAQLSTANSPNGFNPVHLDTVQDMRLQMQWASVPQGDIYIKNPRFQNTVDSPKPIPAAVETTDNVTLSSAAPANGQAVQFAINTTGSAPAAGDWTTGTLGTGVYAATFTKPAGNTYYTFARTAQNTQYPFAGTHTRVKVEHIDDSQAIADAAAHLTWDTIRNANANQSGVRTALTLPTTGANDTAIEWSAVPAGIIDTATGNATRDHSEDKAVTLTATITKGNATPVTKTFNLTVASTANELAEVFIDFNDANTFAPSGDNGKLLGNGIDISLNGDNSPVARVTQSGVDAVQVGDFMYVIVDDPLLEQVNKVELEVKYWRPSATGGISLHYNTIYPGNFSGYEAYRQANIPAAGSGNSWVTSKVVLNGVNFAIGAQNQGAHFRLATAGSIIQSIRITEIPPTDAEAIQLASDALTWDAIKGTNTRQDLVETDLTLAEAGSASTNIVWTSTNNTVINSDTGAVARQQANEAVTLTATISKGTATSVVKTFHIVVRGTGTGTDEDAVNYMLNKLTWDLIKGVNASEADGGMDNVTTNLVLPSMGENMTDITWTTSAATLITAAGVIPTNRPDGGGEVTLTATVKRGPVAAPVTETKTFVLTVPDRYDYTNHMRTAIAQEHDAKDWAISDFNVLAFGAKTEEMAEDEGLVNFDNREAFQAAIDAAYHDGGGVVYIPAGTYAFRTETTGTINVRSTTGSTTYEYKQVLNLRAGVQLRGEWDNPDAEDYDDKIDGTILAVYAGKGTDNYDTYVDSDERENQTGGKKVANVSDRFIDMEQGTGVSNLSVWYPEQDLTAETVVEVRGADGQKTGQFETINGIPYPWTFYQRTGNSATLDSVTLVNAWGGFISLPSEMHYVVNSNMTALYKGIVVHTCTDIGRIEDVNMDPKYWANSGLDGAPTLSEARAYTRANATGFMMHRSDWEYVSGLYVSGYKTGMWIGREPGGDEAPNAQFYGIKIEDSQTGVYIDNVNGFGLLISNSEFGGDTAVYFNERFNTSVQFNGVAFKGPIVSNARGGVISFEDSTFDEYDDFALNFLGRGNALVSQSNFKQANKHANLGANFGTFKSVNSGYNLNIESADLAAHIDNLNLDVDGGGNNTTVQIVNDVEYLFEPIPKDVKTDIDVHPRPTSNAVLRLDFPRSLTSNAPTVDISAKLQEALDYMKQNHGGGTIYLPGGRYKLDNPVIIPEGVELRGTWDVQHHTQGGGTAIFTTYTGGAQGENGASLIQLKANAGLRGLTITQANLTSVNLNNPDQTLKTPFLVQGQGAGVYAINLTIPIGDKGIDLASYPTDGHYVDYLGGTLLRAGIWVGGGAEGGFIRNMQFNPHYALRLPGGQGYSAPSGDLYGFVQRYSSALKFSDVEDQTIFNNFVFGSVYGIHFLKRDLGNGEFAYPGKMTMIGHGSDGTTYALYVEDADEHTEIIAINSELVNTNIATEPNRAYVKMGEVANTEKIHPDAELVLYNSAFWGSPTTAGAVVYNGNVRFQQANFTQLPGNNPGIDVYGGKAHVYSSYFQPSKDGQNNNVYAMLREGGTSIELSNNYFAAGMRNSTPVGNPYGIYGADLLAEPFVFNLTENGDQRQINFKYNVGGRVSAPGTLTIASPAAYAEDFTPVKFDALAAGESVSVDLPYYVAGLITFELHLEDGNAYAYTAKFDAAYAEKVSSAGSENPAKSAATPAYVMDTEDYVTAGTWDSPQDLGVKSRFAWDDNNLYAYIVVTDDVHFNSQTGGNIWREDNLQLGIDLRNPVADSTTRNELGFTLTNDYEVIVWAWARPTGANAPTAPIADIEAMITRDEDTKTTIYDLKIPFNTVLHNPASALANGRIGISTMLNENDGSHESDGARATFEVVGGHLKSSNLFTDLYLLSAGEYNERLEASASAAVDHALASESAADIAMARNFVAIMADGAVKTDLQNRIDAIAAPGNPSNPGTVWVPPTTVINVDSSGNVTVSSTPKINDSSNIAQTTLSQNEIEHAFGRATGESKRINMKLSSIDNAKGYALGLPTSWFKGESDRSVAIETSLGTVVMSNDMLNAAQLKGAGNTVTIVVRQADKSGWSGQLIDEIGDRPVLDLLVMFDNKVVAWSNSEAPVTIMVPYTPTASEKQNADQLVVWYVDAEGNVTPVPNGRYDSATGQIVFQTSHFSHYAVAYAAPKFSDLGRVAWAANAIEALAARGVVEGTSATTFDPGTAISRGEFLAQLIRLLELDAEFTENFADVKASSPYYKELGIGRALGIVKGVGGNKFLPDAEISREDVAAIIKRALDQWQNKLPEVSSKSIDDFKDGAKAASYAREGLAYLLSVGLLQGNSNNTLNPKGNLTRAEAAVILYRIYTQSH
ncbi:S-layer homology domain-containing protein [Paenibacillus sp. LHD-117]|uniref:immunoglobulin-like domain-containing protein n=1 Tax=Paenibacillus sp. LHD-117 TaxID=3071412 RepID=UPI0027DF94C6|nr:immunoglobulin-like domain-containing protein [Paenibacillus sp. LHD-117]MDQ6419063.1 S-layer homology domain-containing protein [Paenibacillus sp. LHD-117]